MSAVPSRSQSERRSVAGKDWLFMVVYTHIGFVVVPNQCVLKFTGGSAGVLAICCADDYRVSIHGYCKAAL